MVYKAGETYNISTQTLTKVGVNIENRLEHVVDGRIEVRLTGLASGRTCNCVLPWGEGC